MPALDYGMNQRWVNGSMREEQKRPEYKLQEADGVEGGVTKKTHLLPVLLWPGARWNSSQVPSSAWLQVLKGGWPSSGTSAQGLGKGKVQIQHRCKATGREGRRAPPTTKERPAGGKRRAAERQGALSPSEALGRARVTEASVAVEEGVVLPPSRPLPEPMSESVQVSRSRALPPSPALRFSARKGQVDR
jgi:hypothetical protein